MSHNRSASTAFDNVSVDRSDASGDRRRGRSSGRRRVVFAVGLLFFVICILVINGPVALPLTGQREAILPGLTIEDAGNPKELVVTSVQGNSIADDTGIQVGDRIVAIDGAKVSSRAEARQYLDKKRPIVIDMKLVRQEQPMEVIYAFPKRRST